MQETPIMTKEIESSSRCNVPPNLNISWVISTGLCFWFLWIHAPVVLSAKDYIEPLLYIHLVGAYSIYMACAHNTLLTPSSLGGAARPFHVWIGRGGLLLGVIGFLTGAVLTWFIYDYTQSWGFSIGITYGGLEQMRAQFSGYRAIRRFQKVKAQIDACEYVDNEELCALQDEQDEHLGNHVEYMINLFLLACGIPAMIRIVEPIGFIYLPIFIIIAFCLRSLMIRSFLQKIKAKRDSERNGVGVGETNYYTFIQ